VNPNLTYWISCQLCSIPLFIGSTRFLFSSSQHNRRRRLACLGAHQYICIPTFIHTQLPTVRSLSSDGVRYADARSSVGRRYRSVTKLRLEWYGGVFLLLQQRSKHPREMVITPKASTSLLIPLFVSRTQSTTPTCLPRPTSIYLYTYIHTYATSNSCGRSLSDPFYSSLHP